MKKLLLYITATYILLWCMAVDSLIETPYFMISIIIMVWLVISCKHFIKSSDLDKMGKDIEDTKF